MKYKHVIWDWNGTLLDDAELCLGIINELLKQRNLQCLSMVEYREIFTFPVKDYYAKLFDFEKESFETLGSEWMRQYEERKSICSLAEGAAELVRRLYDAGVKQYVLSAYSLHALIDLLKKFELFDFMESVKGLNNIYAHSKTDLGVELIEEINGERKDIVMIGDTLHDADVAERMGISSILLSCGHQSKDKLETAGCLVLNSVNNLNDYLL